MLKPFVQLMVLSQLSVSQVAKRCHSSFSTLLSQFVRCLMIVCLCYKLSLSLILAGMMKVNCTLALCLIKKQFNS